MRTPKQYRQEQEAAAQQEKSVREMSNEPLPIATTPKRGWGRLIMVLVILVILVVGGCKFATRNTKADDAPRPVETTSETRRVGGFFGNKSNDDGPVWPVMIWRMGDKAEFEYDGMRFQVAGGSGPVGDGFFVRLLPGSDQAYILDANGTERRVAVDREHAPDLRRGVGGRGGGVSGGTRDVANLPGIR